MSGTDLISLALLTKKKSQTFSYIMALGGKFLFYCFLVDEYNFRRIPDFDIMSSGLENFSSNMEAQNQGRNSAENCS